MSWPESMTARWQSSLGFRSLEDHEVHVWRASLDVPSPDQFAALSAALSSDEVARADRFYFQRDRIRFVIARGTLRMLLGRYLGQDPRAIRFIYSAHGKPSLVAEVGPAFLHFNISHAGDLALFAFSRHRAVGVDVERIRTDLECTQIAERFFSVRERATLHTLSAEERAEAFFKAWTRKEAYIKARGEGLSLALHEFDVSLAPGEPAALLATRDDATQVHRWTLRELRPGDGYVAALAVEGDDWQPLCWQWSAPSS